MSTIDRAHTDDDIDRVIIHFQSGLTLMLAEGLVIASWSPGAFPFKLFMTLSFMVIDGNCTTPESALY